MKKFPLVSCSLTFADPNFAPYNASSESILYWVSWSRDRLTNSLECLRNFDFVQQSYEEEDSASECTGNCNTCDKWLLPSILSNSHSSTWMCNPKNSEKKFFFFCYFLLKNSNLSNRFSPFRREIFFKLIFLYFHFNFALIFKFNAHLT